MDISTFFIYGNLLLGIYLTAVGFKFYSPFKGKNKPEKEAAWYKKFGIFFKVFGIILIGSSLFRIFF